MAEPEHTNVIDSILDLKAQEPFVPFTVILTSGDKYRIESGANLVELRSAFFYASPRTKKFVFLRKSEIVALEQQEPKRPSRRKAS